MTDLMSEIISYHQSIKSSLFISGFTLGSFLFSMKSVIIKTMKEEIYDQADYKNDVDTSNKLLKKTGYYDSLKNFSNLLFWAISLSFVSAIINITLGYFKTSWTTMLCIIVTLVAWVIIGRALYYFQSNWSKVFEYAENKAVEEKRLKKKEGSKNENIP
jgi:hypothetical protein